MVDIGETGGVAVHILHVEVEEILPLRHGNILDISEIGLAGTNRILKLVAAQDVMQPVHQ